MIVAVGHDDSAVDRDCQTMWPVEFGESSGAVNEPCSIVSSQNANCWQRWIRIICRTDDDRVVERGTRAEADDDLTTGQHTNTAHRAAVGQDRARGAILICFENGAS